MKKVWTPAARRAFALKMKRARLAARRKRKAGHRHGNPAKLERCVRKVKRSRRARNAYAICTATLKPHRHRRKNAKGYTIRTGHYLVAVKGDQRLYYDGRNFSNKGSARLFPSQSGAAAVGKSLARRYPVLRGYRLYVGHT